MALSTLTEKANGSRLGRLLIDKGTQALRQVFDTYVQTLTSSGTLHDLLNTKKRSLQSLRYKVISAAQWSLLYPSSGSADSKDFDVTLLTCLLRNACGLTPPTTGWNVMPPDADTSIQANILRIKIYRNEVYGHVTKTDLDDKEFESLWNKIANALVALGIPRSEIDALKEEPLSAEEEGYIDQLIAWRKGEDDLKDLIVDYHHEVCEIASKSENEDISRVEKLSRCDFRGTVRKLTSTFQGGTRGWLLEKVDSWFTDPESESQVMILTAGPGFGKSVFAAKVCEIYEKQKKLAACHFCKFNDSNRGNPHRLLQSLASHMCDNIVGFKAELDKELQRSHSTRTLGEAFQIWLNNPLYALGGREPMIIVVDAMDESEVDGKSELLELISEEFPFLPKWIKILITSRPELHVKDKLTRLNPVEIRPTNKDNETDIRHYLKACLSSRPTSVSGKVLSSLVCHCQGSFLFAYYLQQELRDKKDQLMWNHPKSFEVKGIAAFYERQFNRVQSYFRKFAPSEVDFKRFLDVVAVGVSKTQFPLELLRKSINWPESADVEFRKLISEMSSLFPVSDDSLTAYHKSLIDWLWGVSGHEKHAFTVDVRKGNEYLWSTCKKLFKDLTSLEDFSHLKITPVIRYGLEHGMKHLFEVHGGEGDYQWLVDSKLNHIRSSIFPWRMLDDWHNALKRSSIPPDTRYKIWRLDKFRSTYLRCHMQLEKRVRAVLGVPPLYLQMVANGSTVINDDLSDKESAISLLGKGKYVWCEDLNMDNFQSKFAKFNSSRQERIRVAAISPDQQLAAATYEGNAGKISLLQLPDFELLYEYDSKLTSVPVCAFAPDNSVLVYGCINSCLDIKSHKEIPFIANHPDKFLSCSFSPSGNRLVTADSSSFVKLWDVNQKRLLHQFETCNGVEIDCCSFSSSGLFIVANNDYPDSLAIWNSLTLQRIDQRFLGLERNTLTRWSSPFELVEWFQYPVTTTEDSEYTIFEYGTGSLVVQLPNGLPVCRSQNPFSPLCVTELGGKYSCVLTSVFKSVIVLDLASRTIVAEHRMNCQHLYMPGCTPVFFNKESFLLKEVPFISFKTPDQLKFVSPLSDVTITCCTFCDDGLFLATCDNHNVVRIWNVQTCSVAQSHCLKAPAIAGWWSKGCLWLVLPQHLVKIPSDEQHKLIFHELEYLPIHSINDVLAFSDSVLVVVVFPPYSIRVMKIVDDVIERNQILPIKDHFDSAAVGPYGCSILLCSANKCQLWKQVEGDVTKTWQPSPSILHHRSSLDIEGAGVYRYSKCFITPGRTGGILIGIIAVLRTLELDITVVDLSVGRVTKVIKELGDLPEHIRYLRDCPLLTPSLVISLDHDFHVCIHGLSDGALLAMWNTWRGDLISANVCALGYSYRHNLLAIPQEDGYVEFVKIHGTEKLRSVSDHTMW